MHRSLVGVSALSFRNWKYATHCTDIIGGSTHGCLVTCTENLMKFGCVFATCKQTERHTDTRIAIRCPPTGDEVINSSVVYSLSIPKFHLNPSADLCAKKVTRQTQGSKHYPAILQCRKQRQ